MTNTVRDLIQTQRELIAKLFISEKELTLKDDLKILKLQKKIKHLEKKILQEETIKK